MAENSGNDKITREMHIRLKIENIYVNIFKKKLLNDIKFHPPQPISWGSTFKCSMLTLTSYCR